MFGGSKSKNPKNPNKHLKEGLAVKMIDEESYQGMDSRKVRKKVKFKKVRKQESKKSRN